VNKFEVTIRSGSKTRDHSLQVSSQTPAPEADRGRLRVVLDGKAIEVDWAEVASGMFSILLEGRSYEASVARPSGQSAGSPSVRVVTVGTREYISEIRDPRLRRAGGLTAGAEGPQDIVAPMPGKIVRILVSENDRVGAGDALVVIEAMKMQNELHAPRPGQIEKIYVPEGAAVESGFKLLRLG